MLNTYLFIIDVKLWTPNALDVSSAEMVSFLSKVCNLSLYYKMLKVQTCSWLCSKKMFKQMLTICRRSSWSASFFFLFVLLVKCRGADCLMVFG
jgi:hypothetical protein